MLKLRWSVLAAVATLAHSSLWATTPQSQSSANAIGKALGMMLFAYLALKTAMTTKPGAFWDCGSSPGWCGWW